jgi:hypothetical protein
MSETQSNEIDTVDVARTFREVLVDSPEASRPAAELLPVNIARACVSVLPVDGAGLSVFHDDFRVPLGASDEHAGIAERLQFTLSEGPCLSATQLRRPLAASPAQLTSQWPHYADALLARTPYRAVISIPFPAGEGIDCALDLYLVRPTGIRAVALADAAVITDEIAVLMTEVAADRSDTGTSFPSSPRWAQTAPALQRMNVWVAGGILMAAFNIEASDALALLRSHAYTSEYDLDEMADAIVSGSVQPSDLAP